MRDDSQVDSVQGEPAELNARGGSSPSRRSSSDSESHAFPGARARDGQDDAWADLLPPQGTRHLLAIDTPSFMHRTFRGCLAHGEQEKAPALLLRRFARWLRGRQPSHVVFAGEGLDSLRRELSTAYKANREEPPGYAGFVARVEAALAGAGYPVMRAPRLEAEDVIAAVERKASAAPMPVVIVTHDKDLEQLVRERFVEILETIEVDVSTVVWDGDARVRDEAAVAERRGVQPRRLAEALALAGDDSDGIAGVPSWGEKTAAKVIASLGDRTLAEVIQPGWSCWIPVRYRKLLTEYAARVRLGLDLIRLRPELVRLGPLDDHRVDALALADELMAAAARYEGDGR